ncbi:MAG: orotidine-5'-phosphate decarboxylase [Candidatus Cloacimonadaceae bacterium]|nr:orotidine-5'-phosphate decarboxylase [Candidatus Cloacimonadaceae bacterium]
MQTGSLVCIGLDSDMDQLPQSCLKDSNPIRDFNLRLVDATLEYAAAFKPNLAFYLKDGLRGIEALYETLEYIPQEVPVIIDCKVGDIGNTMDAYVSSFFDSFSADAITINPLMGTDVISSLLKNPKAYGFVLNLTSNPSAADFLKKDNLAANLAGLIMQHPKERLGAVVGATQTEELKDMRKLLPERIFLIPGIGAQGGDLDAVMKYAIHTKAEPNILINSSRGIIFKDKSENFAAAAGLEARKLQDSIKEKLEK